MIVYPTGYPASGVGLLLEDDPERRGRKMIQEKVQPINVQPDSWDYGSQSPFVERTATFNDWSLGGGQRQQGDGPIKRYSHGIDADASIQGQVTKGPELVSVTPTAGGAGFSIAGFEEHTVAGTKRLCALAGTKLLVRTADTAAGWEAAFTHAVALKKARRWKPTGAGAIEGLFIATASGAYIRYAGAVLAEAPVSLPVNAQSLEVSNENLWVSDGSTMRKVTADPTVLANYTAVIQVGNTTETITNLVLANNVMYAFRPDGIFGLNADGTSRDLYPGLHFNRDTRAGVGAAVLGGVIYANVSKSLISIEGASGALDSVGPDRLVENTSEVQGEVMCSTFHRNWGLYSLLYNSANGNTYLCKYGSWLNPDESNRANWQFAQVWHLGLRKVTGRQATACYVTEITGQPRLYIGYADGTIDYAILPKNTPNPLSDTAYRYVATDGDLHFPLWHGGWEADVKDILAASVFGSTLDSLNYAQVLLGSKPGVSPSSISASKFDVLPGKRLEASLGSYGQLMPITLRLTSSSTSTTPSVSGVGIHFRVRPAVMLSVQGTWQATPGKWDRAGRPYTYAPTFIRDLVRSLAAEVEPVAVVLPDGRLIRAGVNLYGEHLHQDHVRQGLQGWSIPFTAVEYQPMAVFGTVGRMSTHTVGELNGYTVGAMESI